MYEAEDERYCYRGTTVLKNKGGYRSQIDLDKFEALNVSHRMAQRLPRGQLNTSHYRAIHRWLFQDVYSWSGRYRTVSISKGQSEFCQPEYIAQQMERLFASFADENYFRDLETEDFSAKAANFLSNLNAIHPFREGNGRTQNMFLGLLADQAGHPLNFDRISPLKFLEAMVMAFYGDEEPLKVTFLNAVRA
jgi:cell filamentation protein